MQLLVLAIFWIFRSIGNQRYVLIIDAGSSGTRMNAYAWRRSHEKRKGSPHIVDLSLIPPDRARHKVPRRALETRRAYTRVETEPGLHKFTNSPSSLGPKALEPLLEWARAVIPSNHWPSTPVFLFGTAGMRKLNEIDSEVMLNEARRTLRESGFLFREPWARVVTGVEEGVLGWVSLNYKRRKLGTEDTMGALDLGGSSLQVTFAAASDREQTSHSVFNSSAMNVSAMGAAHTVYSYSHHHFGLDDAFERSIIHLLQEKDEKGNVSGIGDEAKRGSHRSQILASDAISNIKTQPVGGSNQLETETGAPPEVAHPCLHHGFRQRHVRIPLDGRPPVPPVVDLKGQPDLGDCKRIAQAVASAASDTCVAPPCNSSATPHFPATATFVGLSGFYVVSHFFGLRGDDIGINNVLQQAGDSFCSMDWTQVHSKHTGELSPETYCFRAAYVSALVTQGLHLREDQVIIGDRNDGWTLGAALVEGQRFYEDGVAKVKAGLGDASLLIRWPWSRKVVYRVLWISIILAFLGFAGHQWWRRRLVPARASSRLHLQRRSGQLSSLMEKIETGSEFVENSANHDGRLATFGRPLSRSATFSRRLSAQDSGIADR